jgi:heavy metal sensor kinase
MVYQEHAQDGRGIKRPAGRASELLSCLAARSRALCASNRSTQTRLTVYFTMLFGVIVAGLAVASYFVVTHAVYSDLDFSLHVATAATAMSAQHEIAEHSEKQDAETDMQSVLDVTAEDSLPDTQILIREGERIVAYKHPKKGIPDLRTKAEGLRIASQQLAVPKFHTTYQIYAAGSLAPVLRKLTIFRWILLIGVPFGLSLAACAGYLLARRALAPLADLTRTIERVTSSHLSERVPVSRSEGDLDRLASSFNSLLDRLETAFNVQRRFMADASHELRTPLTVALSAAQVTMRDGQRTVRDCDESLALVEAQLLRLRRIIDNLLFLSQADAESLRIEQREFYLDDAVADAARAASALARPKRQIVQIGRLPEALCLGDEDLLKQATLILLDNAVKYTHDGGHIDISLYQDADSWICRIGNDGPPIPADAQSRIFERFFRGPAGNGRKTSGAGLGLAIARSIAETHAGSLNLVSSSAGRTVFELRIPVFQDVEASADQAKSLAVKI